MITRLRELGLTVFFENLSYRQYSEVADGAHPELGSLPFNTNVMNAVIRDLAPDCWDGALNTARIDNYSLLFDKRKLLDADGVHPSALAGYPAQRAFWVDTAMRYAYTGHWPKAYSVQVVERLEASRLYEDYYNALVITRDLPASGARAVLQARVELVKNDAFYDQSRILVTAAETLLTQKAKDDAKAFIDQVTGYTSQVAALRARLDAIKINNDRVAVVSFGTNLIAPPAQSAGSVTNAGVRIANMKDYAGQNTGWSLAFTVGTGYTATSGGWQPEPNETGFPLDTLLHWGSISATAKPVAEIRGLDPAKRYSLENISARAAGVGALTISINDGVVTQTVANRFGPSATLKFDNVAPVDLGGGVYGIRIAYSSTTANTAINAFRLTEHN